MTPVKKAYIAWTEEEIAILAQDAAARRLEDPIPALTLLVARAQAARLPPDRRRKLASVTQSPALVKGIREELARLRAATATEIPVVMAAPPVEINAGELASRLTDAELIHEGAERVIKMLALFRPGPIRANIAAIGTPTPPRILEVAPAERRDRPPLVSLIGPTADQFAHISEKCKGMALELAFVDKDKRKSPPTTTDYLVIQSRFISHKRVEELKAISALKGRIVELDPSDGVTGICKALADLNAKIGMKR